MAAGDAEAIARRRTIHAVYAVAALALAAKLVVSWFSKGSSDIGMWEFFLRILRREGGATLYANYPQFNHPPSIVHLLHGIAALRKATGWPLPFCIRLPAILADFGSIVLLVRILGPSLHLASTRTVLCTVAAAPVSLMVSGHHGNTDPVMICFLLLSLVSYERPGRLGLAGAALGLSLCIKVVPVVVLPAVFLHLASTRRRAVFFGSMLAVVVASWMPYLALDPQAVLRHLFGYGSLAKHWGLSRALHALPAPFAGVAELFDAQGVFFLLACLFALSVWMHRLPSRPSLFRQVGLLFFAFLALTPGFGMQYLAWLVPWTVLVAPLAAAVFHATSGTYLLLAYTGVFGTIQKEMDPGTEPAVIVVPQLLCWLSVLALGWAQMRQIARAGRGQASPT